MRQASFSFISICLGLTLALLLLEGMLRFLPVNEGARPQAVGPDQPVRRLEPNRTFLWSKEWNFRIINTVRTNNYGFVNDQDYITTSSSPLLALIGDSYVEALMVPFSDTVAGRLATQTSPTERVYSFGTSSSALGNYLAYADHAAKVFHPDAMAFIIIGNDFDESLLKYKNEPGHHYFLDDAVGTLALHRIDYRPSTWRTMIRNSALVRYLTLNTGILDTLLKWQHLPFGRLSDMSSFAGNTSTQSDQPRIADSERAVDAFLEKVSTMSKLPPDHILFVVDGIRPHLYHSSTLQFVTGSYVDRMRRYFIDQARERGFEVVDLQPRFSEHFSTHQRRFEFQTDNHWNALGHEVCADAIRQSSVYRQFQTLAR